MIGEAVKKLPAEILADLPEADRAGPARLRDLIAHRYFALDAEIIWEVATRFVPRLRAAAHVVAAKSSLGD